MNRTTKTIAVVVTAEAISHVLMWAWREMRYQREATAPPEPEDGEWSKRQDRGRPVAAAVALDREGLTEPGILRLAANDLRRNYHLGIYGLPRSLPATLDALADAMECDA